MLVENRELLEVVALNHTLGKLKWILEGEFTMDKWDQFTLVVKEHELTDLLDNIYRDLEKVEELRKESKAVILEAVMK